MATTIDLDDRAVATNADRYPDADYRVRAEQLVGYFEHDGENVSVRERVLSGPLEAMERAVGVGEERIAAHTNEQSDRTGRDGLGRAVEADWCVADQNLAAGPDSRAWDPVAK